MSKKNIGLVLILIGVLIAAFSLGADLIGIGTVSGFGWKQIAGMSVGILAALVGIWLMLSKSALKK